MINWPEFFPTPNAQYQLESTQSVINSKKGQRYQRERFKNSTKYSVSCTFDLSLSEFKLWVSFFRFVINNGNQWFNLPLIIGESIEQKTAKVVDGNFSAKYRTDNRFDVSMDLFLR